MVECVIFFFMALLSNIFMSMCMCKAFSLYHFMEHIFSFLTILCYGLKREYLLIVYFFVLKMLHGRFLSGQHL